MTAQKALFIQLTEVLIILSPLVLCHVHLRGEM
jgi:hypothetical protein